MEGPKLEIFKIESIIQNDIVQNLPLMLVKMEIMSIKDLHVKEVSQDNSKEEADQEKKFYDAPNKLPFDEEVKFVKAKVTTRE